MNLTEIAIFAWLPFLAADLGGIFGGYLSPVVMKFFKVQLINSRIVGIVLGALLMIGPGSIGLVAKGACEGVLPSAPVQDELTILP
jgi:ACS family hexuronate transporter-like MFS transporter